MYYRKWKFCIADPATGSGTITRTCSQKDICENLHAKETNYNKIEDCHTCDTDLCGSGNFNGVPTVMLCTLMVLGTLTSHFLL